MDDRGEQNHKHIRPDCPPNQGPAAPEMRNWYASQCFAGKQAGIVLSPRQRDVLRLLVDGKPDRVIADELGISYRTVTTHTSRLFTKLGVRSRTAAAVAAIRNGII